MQHPRVSLVGRERRGRGQCEITEDSARPMAKLTTTRHTDVVLMLAHRLRRWASIKTTSVYRVVFAGKQLGYTL